MSGLVQGKQGGSPESYEVTGREGFFAVSCFLEHKRGWVPFFLFFLPSFLSLSFLPFFLSLSLSFFLSFFLFLLLSFLPSFILIIQLF